MLTEYIEAALSKAKYELIEDEEPFFGEVPELEGVWATGKTLEECRKNLVEVIDGWILVRLRKGLPIPPIGAYNEPFQTHIGKRSALIFSLES
jgi:predicted RNase H-like HicB family nuclease